MMNMMIPAYMEELDYIVNKLIEGYDLYEITTWLTLGPSEIDYIETKLLELGFY